MHWAAHLDIMKSSDGASLYADATVARYNQHFEIIDPGTLALDKSATLSKTHTSLLTDVCIAERQTRCWPTACLLFVLVCLEADWRQITAPSAGIARMSRSSLLPVPSGTKCLFAGCRAGSSVRRRLKGRPSRDHRHRVIMPRSFSFDIFFFYSTSSLRHR